MKDNKTEKKTKQNKKDRRLIHSIKEEFERAKNQGDVLKTSEDRVWGY